jgi:hypothetical protein
MKKIIATLMFVLAMSFPSFVLADNQATGMFKVATPTIEVYNGAFSFSSGYGNLCISLFTLNGQNSISTEVYNSKIVKTELTDNSISVFVEHFGTIVLLCVPNADNAWQLLNAIPDECRVIIVREKNKIQITFQSGLNLIIQ